MKPEWTKVLSNVAQLSEGGALEAEEIWVQRTSMSMIIVSKEPQRGQCGWGKVSEGFVVKKNY